MIMSPCKDCKGHVLTNGRCHKTCSRYKIYQSENEKAKKDIEETINYSRSILTKYKYTKERYV